MDRKARSSGYPVASINGRFTYLHVHIMEQHLGRKLAGTEEVHHRDGRRSNNSLDNLQLCASRQEHLTQHRQELLQKLGLPIHFRKCPFCKTWANPSELVTKVRGKSISYFHAACNKDYMKAYSKEYRVKRKAQNA